MADALLLFGTIFGVVSRLMGVKVLRTSSAYEPSSINDQLSM